MALRSTVFKARLVVGDLDRGHYGEHALTIARHPSETDERMMVRVVAFALYASERLAFGRGLSDVDDPDLVERDLTGRITTWIEVGLPDERAVAKAASKADRVVVFAYGRDAARWWQGAEDAIRRIAKAEVLLLDAETTRALAALVDRSMTVEATIQEGTVWLGVDGETVQFTPRRV